MDEYEYNNIYKDKSYDKCNYNINDEYRDKFYKEIINLYDRKSRNELISLLVISLQYERFNDRTLKVVKLINELCGYINSRFNINDYAKTEEERILESSISQEGIPYFSRTLFNLANLNFIDNIINGELNNFQLDNMSPFVKLGLYSLFDSKANNQVDLANLNSFRFSTLLIKKDNSNEVLNNEKILKRIRNGLTHDQFYIYIENEKLYLHFNNKNYFEATIALEEVFSLFDSILHFPLEKNDFSNNKKLDVLADELLLNLIFNNNKDHFLTEYKSEDYCKINASVFISNWMGIQNNQSKEFSRLLFLFKDNDDRLQFETEYGNTFNRFNGYKKKLFRKKYKTYKDYNIPYITLSIPRYYVDFDLMSYDPNNNIHIPTNILLNKLRNSVAHGRYLYDSDTDAFLFYDSKGNQSPNFSTIIGRENLRKFLYNPLFIETLLLPETVLKVIKLNNESKDPMFSHLTQMFYTLNSTYYNNLMTKKGEYEGENIKSNYIESDPFSNFDTSPIAKYTEIKILEDEDLNDNNLNNKPKF